MRKLTALVAAAALAVTSLAPAVAEARDGRGRGHYDRHYDHHYDRHYDRRHHRDRDDGDALAAGAVGLILGLAIGSLASQPRAPATRCYDNYRRCAPPQRYYGEPGYYDYDRRSAYEGDYGYGYAPEPYYAPPPARCARSAERWDPYARRYVVVTVPC